jgi:hypothetical protein
MVTHFIPVKNVLKLNLLNLHITMKFKQPIYFILCALLAAGLASCASSSEDKSKNSDEFDEANETL